MSSRVPKVKPTINDAVRKLVSVVNQSLIAARTELLSRNMDKPGRDLDTECGYPTNPTIVDYRNYYQREGIATRVVNVYPDECWSALPEVYETDDEKELPPFEQGWNALIDRLNPLPYLHRVDEVSGIGRCGILVIGVRDGQDPSKPVQGLNEDGNPSVGRPPVPDHKRLM
jgi:hypothetical protein